MKYLFVCRNNLARSPAAARFFSNLLKKHGLEGEVMSVGLSEMAPNKLTLAQLEGADVVFVMDKKLLVDVNTMAATIKSIEKKLINLDIPDVYYYGAVREDLIDKVELKTGEKIRNRAEIKKNLTLDQVLESKTPVFQKYLVR